MIKTKNKIYIFFMFLLFGGALFLFTACGGAPQKEDPIEEPEPEITHTITVNLGILNDILPEDVPTTFEVAEGTILSLDDNNLQLIKQNTPEGYHFEQIKIGDENGDTLSTLEVTDDVTLYAVFSVELYGVTFFYDNKQLATQSKYTLNSEINIASILEELELLNFEENKTGLYFVGWSNVFVEEFNFNSFIRYEDEEDENENNNQNDNEQDENNNQENENQNENNEQSNNTQSGIGILDDNYITMRPKHQTAQEFVESFFEGVRTQTSIKIGKTNNLYAVYAPEKYEGISVEDCQQTSFYYGEPLPSAQFGYTFNGQSITHCPDLGDNEENVNAEFIKFEPEQGTTNLYVTIEGTRYDLISIDTLTDLSNYIYVNPEFNLNIKHIYINGVTLAINVTGRIPTVPVEEPENPNPSGDPDHPDPIFDEPYPNANEPEQNNNTNEPEPNNEPDEPEPISYPDPFDDYDPDEQDPIDMPNPALNGETDQIWKFLPDVEGFTKNGFWIHSGGDVEVTYTID